MKQNELRPKDGSRSGRKRVGRGVGSGHGTYACKGCKGQKARSGGGVGLRFEGGQTPLVKRLPRIRGFTNIFKTQYAIVNLRSLQAFDEGTEVTPRALAAAGLVPSLRRPVKILGVGELRRSLVVRANKFSKAARSKIEAAGGTAEEIQGEA
jgi:large subunit ribosomal protein L15